MHEPIGNMAERASDVLDSAKLPFALGRERSEMLKLLMHGTDVVRFLILAVEPVERAEMSALRMKNALEVLQVEFATFPSEFRPPPPAIPEGWKVEIQQWIAKTIPNSRRGHPGSARRNALLILRGFYCYAFGDDPADNDGHFHDFVNAWLHVFGPEMQAATGRIRPGDKRKSLSKEWLPLKRDALRKALSTCPLDDVVKQQISSWHHENAVVQLIKESNRR